MFPGFPRYAENRSSLYRGAGPLRIPTYVSTYHNRESTTGHLPNLGVATVNLPGVDVISPNHPRSILVDEILTGLQPEPMTVFVQAGSHGQSRPLWDTLAPGIRNSESRLLGM